MSANPSKSYWMCRSFDPAIDLTPIVKTCESCGGSGDRQTCAYCEGAGMRENGACPSCEGEGKLLCDCGGAGTVNATRSDVVQFMKDRDHEAHLAFDSPDDVVWFKLRPISVRERRSHVDDVPGGIEDEDALRERYWRAFEVACVEIRGLRDEDGTKLPTITPKRTNRGIEMIQTSALDELCAMGLGDYDIWDIGSVAYWRSKLPLGAEVSYRPPRSSLYAMRTMMKSFRRAAEKRAARQTASTPIAPDGATPGNAPVAESPTQDAPAPTSAAPSTSGATG